MAVDGSLLHGPRYGNTSNLEISPSHTLYSGTEYPTPTRANVPYARFSTFELDKQSDQRYQQQYGDMYFLRLAKLKPAVERIATDAWEGYQVSNIDQHEGDDRALMQLRSEATQYIG